MRAHLKQRRVALFALSFAMCQAFASTTVAQVTAEAAYLSNSDDNYHRVDVVMADDLSSILIQDD